MSDLLTFLQMFKRQQEMAKNKPLGSQASPPPREPEIQRFLKHLDDLKRAVLIRAFETADSGELAKKLEAAAVHQLEETPSLRTRWCAYDKVVQKIVERFIEETHRLARASTSAAAHFPGAPEPREPEAPRITIAAEPSEWRVRLRPEGAHDPVSVVLSVTPGAIDPSAHPPGCLAPGCGPGPLVWQLVEDAGVPGLFAVSGRGRFKILHVSGESWALFYEHEAGGWDELGVGTPEALKRVAAARAHHGATSSTPVH